MPPTPPKAGAAALRKSPRKHVSSPIKGYSPGWVNPRDAHRKFKAKLKVRRLVPSENSCPPALRPVSPGAVGFDPVSPHPLPQPSVLRKRKLSLGRNKFHASPKKRRGGGAFDVIQQYLVDENSSNALLCSLEAQDNRFGLPSSSSAPVDFSGLIGPPELGDLPFTSDAPTHAPVPSRLCVPPLDLRLATKLRVLSPGVFPWGSAALTLSSGEKARAAAAAAQGHLFRQHKEEMDVSEVKIRLGAVCVYFVSPALPWIESFPRRLDDSGKRGMAESTSAPSIINAGAAILEPLRHAWEESFSSLYLAWRTGLVPFFYFCAPNFTVLFLDARSSQSEATAPLERGDSSVSRAAWAEDPGGRGLRAVITPTTKGLRYVLRDEGLEFTCPLRPDSRRNSRQRRSSTVEADSTDPVTQSQPPLEFHLGGQPDDEKEEGSEDDDPTQWLDDVEISPSAVSKFRRALSDGRLSAAAAPTPLEDPGNTPCLVMGRVNLQTLFNWLSTTKLAGTVSGPQAGLPPTLLSPTPFHGGAQASLTLRSSTSNGTRARAAEATLELSGGPIMPHVPFLLGQLLKKDGRSFTAIGRTQYQGLNAAAGGTLETRMTDVGRRLEAAAHCAGPITFQEVASRELFFDSHQVRAEDGFWHW